MGVEGKEKAAATFYAPDSIPAGSRQEKECTVLIRDGMKLTLLQGENKFWIFSLSVLLISLNRCDLPQFFIVCVVSLGDDVSGDVL